MDTHTTRNTMVAMYERLGAGDGDGATQMSAFRRMGVALLALLVVASMPLYGASTAFADGSDESTAPITSKSGSDDDDDDEDDGDETTDGNGKSDGVDDTRGTDGAGDTKGTALTDKGPNTHNG